MKKAALVIIALILATGSLWAIDPRLSAMGDIGIAVRGSDMQSYPNPASVFFDDNRMTFTFHLDVEDTLGYKSLPYMPSSSVDVNFVADMITLGLSIACITDNFNETNNHVNLFQKTELNVNFSIGTGAFSAGIGITGGSSQQRLDVVMNSIWDFPVQAYFSPFDRVANSEFIQVSAGFMTIWKDFSFGIRLADILGKDGSSTVLNFQTLFSHAGAGIYYSKSKYSSRGVINPFVYSLGVDVDYIFSEARSLSAGGEVMYRLARDSSIFARAGYKAYLSNLGDGTITAGMGATFRKIEVSLNGDFPVGGIPRAKVILTLLF